MLQIHTGNVRLWLPVPMYVLADLLDSAEDICALALQILVKPNYVAMLKEIIASIGAAHGNQPLLDIQTEDVHISMKRISLGGRV